MNKFDEMFDLNELMTEISEADNDNDSNFKEVPFGQYEVMIERLYFGESKGGKPMVTCWFKIIAGEFKRSILFWNQVVTRGFQIKIVNNFLESLETGEEIYFSSFEQYSNLIDEVYDKASNGEFALDYKEGRNGFNEFKITQVF